ncbi:aurora kinase A and ninein-interacting protein [Suncus etruscus]|uniref:aurora kinase A and ninein-interacting protein n=1 Tax=Suncus etruscus TaxID=109475 RepID=UPI00211048A6|nr:aurora kinase A and ninein-interacting protein [Suncus etruscus]
MKRRGRGQEEKEACGVWLDAAALKRRKVQTHLITSNTKMLTLFPGERKTKVSLTQRTPPAGIRQTSIASFFILQPGKTNGGDKRSDPSLTESQINKSKEDVTQHPVQDMGHYYITSPLVTSTPAGTQEVEFAHCIQASDCHSTGASGLTVLSALQPETFVCDGEKKASMAYPLTHLESSCSLNLEEEEDSSRKRKWFHGSMKNNYQSVERHMKSLGGKSKRPLDRTKLGRVSAKENRQAPVQTYKDSWNGENTESVKQSPPPVPISRDIENSNSWSQLFTLDSQGQQVIAHNSRSPLREVTNNWNQDLEWSPSSPWSKCQDRATQLNLQPDLLFTQDSEGNQLFFSPSLSFRQDCCRRCLIERQKHLR